MIRLPLALTATIRVDAAHVLKDKRIHDLAHQMLEEMLMARMRIGSTPPGLPSIPGFSVS